MQMFCSVTPWISTGHSRCVNVGCTVQPNWGTSYCFKSHRIDKPSSLRGVLRFLCMCDRICYVEIISLTGCWFCFRYYAFHDVFVREVLGKKLSKGTKKDLDDISAKTAVTLKSCRRQVNLTPQPPSAFVVRGSQLSVAYYSL